MKTNHYHSKNTPHKMGELEYCLLDLLQSAAVMEEFTRLTSTKVGYSLNQAAHKLERPSSYFSGEKSMFSRYQYEGIIGLLPKRSKNKVQIFELLLKLREQRSRS